MKAILGRKLGMTRIFGEKGRASAVTVVEALPNTVHRVKSKEKDGYFAYQIGTGARKHANRALKGQFKDAVPAVVSEFRESWEEVAREEAPSAFKEGDLITVDNFKAGELVTITGTSKGKGFAGTIKRHNFARGPKTHGSHNYRAPGSIGSMYPEHVTKGHRMPGRTGGQSATVKNAKVAAVDKDKNLILISGGIPGANKGYVLIKGRNTESSQGEKE